MSRVFRLLPDSFTAAIIAVVALAVMLPCSGDSARLVGIGSEVAIAVLFFLQGARLSRSAVLGAALHWRLHGIILAATFLVFPLLGLALSPLSAPDLGAAAIRSSFRVSARRLALRTPGCRSAPRC